ncbi:MULTISPECIES: amidase domain-containing protein [unclassified Bacillus (in: firmicutes)]|uniref:amidase domain-containing protein n=1 Tax=unclassified Bacillus (in: firmicutes) TaxID=185979 RepID=UPI001BEC4453|nr:MULTISPECIES: amidase domain-containing protein [unclassified Bacillus (in: firmicutes)]MBT2615079.1 amidase domain-containing protein [Bacillus sp. ISL-78]MBT2627696.1 amidase domain-containing protein [Bacillus sp. ISL-101]MBT2716910.1 amidase domain-containing protein [Bacillus sp. ISL-57]
MKLKPFIPLLIVFCSIFFFSTHQNVNGETLPVPLKPTGATFSNGDGTGYVDLSWEQVPGATSYKVWLYNGKEYETFDVGNTTTWSTKNKKLWPTVEEINTGRYALHHDSKGSELSVDPSDVYRNSKGNYTTNKNYWFKISAVIGSTETEFSTIYKPTIPNLKIPDITGKAFSNGDSSGYVNLSWNSVDGAAGYKVWVFNGKEYESFDAGNATTWSSKNKNIWPTDTEINGGKYNLHLYDKSGQELVVDPSQVYSNAGTQYASSNNYWFRISAYNELGETVTSTKSMYKPSIPDLEIPDLYGNLYSNGDEHGTGFADLKWEPIENATGYNVWIFNGESYESFDVGNVNTFTTREQKIWPTTQEENAGIYKLHHDKKGVELANSPSKVYCNSNGNYCNSKNYYFKVTAYNSHGETEYSNFVRQAMNEKARENYTFKEAEDLFVSYLNEKKLDYPIGSSEFTNYVLDQEYGQADEDLLQHSLYSVIAAYLSEYEYAYETTSSTDDLENTSTEINLEFINTLERLRSKTIGEVEKSISAEEADSTIETGATILSAYSVSKAKDYAKKWYNSRNNFSYQSEGNDCTNFVSQIIYAGGKSKKKPSTIPGGIYGTTKYWYSYKYDGAKVPYFKRSSSWVNVSDFYAFWSKTQSTKSSTSKSTLISYADVGDVIQFKKKNKTRYSHSMFVYEKSNNTLYLSGHTDNYLKRNFKNISPEWIKYRVIKF